MLDVFSEAERRAWSAPQKLSPSEWADTHRHLPASVAAEAGRYSCARTPYIRGILDAAADPVVEEIICLKSTQVGWSTATENILGWWIDQEPGPCLFVLPSESAAGEIVEERIRPLIASSEALRRHAPSSPHDDTKTGIKFDTMALYMGWAGSPATLARRAVRYLVCDEVDKYPPFSGREADPISLGRERTATFMHRRKVLIGSTPTTRNGNIWRAWESAGDRRRYHVPCPHCSEYQPLVFSGIKWLKIDEPDKFKLSDQIEQHSLAWYECAHCKARIEESQKNRLLARGVWLSEGQTIDRDGGVVGPRPKAKRVGFWINALYSPWLTFSRIAAEFIRSKDDPSRLMNFRNSWLAEPFDEQIKSTTVDALRKLFETQKAAGNLPKARIVPKWAGAIAITVDTQKDHFWFVVRAWGADHKSQLVDFGVYTSFAELAEKGLNTPYAVDGGDLILPSYMLIDAGYRTEEIYQFAQTDDRIIPVKGASHSQDSLVKFSTAGREFGVALRILNSEMLKDRLANYRERPDKWLMNDGVTDEYFSHHASEHKIYDRIKGVERWEPKSEGMANHILDCEYMQFAAAEIMQVFRFPSESEILRQRAARLQQQQSPPRPQQQKSNGWLGQTSGWLR